MTQTNDRQDSRSQHGRGIKMIDSNLRTLLLATIALWLWVAGIWFPAVVMTVLAFIDWWINETI